MEDSAAIQAQLVATLGAVFDVVKVASTAREATLWLADNPRAWDLMVVDIFLKQGHGYEVLGSCAQRLPQQAVVVLSNYTLEPARSSALRQGATAVFDKSFEMEAFIAYCMAYAREHGMEGARRSPEDLRVVDRECLHGSS